MTKKRFLLKGLHLAAYFLRRRRSSSTSSDQNTETHLQQLEDKVAHNPYLQSKLLWNDVYGNVEQKWRSSRRLNFILIGLIGVALVGFIQIASKTRTQPLPFIIHGDEIITVADSEGGDWLQTKTQLVPYFAKQFIQVWRSLSTDATVNTQNQMAAYAFTSDAATAIVHDFYQAEGSDENITKNIVITSVLSLSPHTIDVRWKEEWRSAQTGKLIRVMPYLAQLTYDYAEPSRNTSALRINPLGFYITQLAWSLDQAVGENHENHKS